MNINFKNELKNALIILFFLVLISSCRVQKNKKDPSYTSILENSTIFQQHYLGFMLYDPEEDVILHEINSDKYFIPASNTKLFTLYTALRVLQDSVPSLKYSITNDTLRFTGTGDPSFLNPHFTTNKTFDFLNKRDEVLIYSPAKYHDVHFGAGWSWDDYKYSFSSEKSSFPIYGNTVKFAFGGKEDLIDINPPYFKNAVQKNSSGILKPGAVERSLHENIFQFRNRIDTLTKNVFIPFKYSTEIFIELLSDTLKQPVLMDLNNDEEYTDVYYGFSADSLYREMMWESDNFIAEQLLLVCASTVADSMNTKMIIEYAKENYFNDFPDKLQWVDGSGLSRYNLFTPRSIIEVWKRLYREIPEERLLNILSAGGLSGTLKNQYKAAIPFLYGKSGTMSNVHSLSGILITDSGKKLLFSFMHNNYITPTASIRYEMEKVLREIKSNF